MYDELAKLAKILKSRKKPVFSDIKPLNYPNMSERADCFSGSYVIYSIYLDEEFVFVDRVLLPSGALLRPNDEKHDKTTGIDEVRKYVPS